ncbi:MAG: methyltransferase domain-containing protein [Actinobacteria bacterium]|nr:methyltransferase domain-containing protein [Actinomycetota bacterium]
MSATDPQAATSQVTEGFAAAADRYDTTGTEFFTIMGEHLVAHTRVPAGAWVLDVGCGKGAVSFPAARAAGPFGQVTGIDLAAPMLAHARDHAARDHVSNVRFEEGHAEDPGWEPGSFDVVLAGNVIQFLARPAHAVRRWRALLTPPGRLGISWSLAEDPRWRPVIAAFDTAMPAGQPGFAATLRRPAFDSVEAMHGLLAGAGLRHPASVTHPVTMTYTGPAQWWAAAQSQGPWAVAWRHIPAAALERARQQAFALLEPLRAADGTLTRTLTFACTSARKTPGPAPSSISGDH